MLPLSPSENLLKFRAKLLEDHMKKLREEDGVETEDDDDESKWEGWDVETDSSDSSDEEDWINVDSDDNDIVVTDSEGEEKPTEESCKAESSQPLRVSTLATSKVVCIFLVNDNLSNTYSRSLLQQILPCSMNYVSKKRPKLSSQRVVVRPNENLQSWKRRRRKLLKDQKTRSSLKMILWVPARNLKPTMRNAWLQSKKDGKGVRNLALIKANKTRQHRVVQRIGKRRGTNP